jgi:hypothetical protein
MLSMTFPFRSTRPWSRLPRRRNLSIFFPASSACLLLLALSCFPRPTSAAAQNSAVVGRAVTRAEGMSIVEAISEQQKSIHDKSSHVRRSKPDCSHLVNAIYDHAGFPYSYANSSDLYRGHSSFVRISAPQPGDLIVWRGHVGLVVDPREHFFFSSLRSGFDTEDYTSPYWRRHGAPRFYRYFLHNSDPYLTARQFPQRNEAEGNFQTVALNQSSQDERDESRETRYSRESVNAPSGISKNSDAQQNSDVEDPSVPVSYVISLGATHDKPTVKQVNDAISAWHQTTLAGLRVESLMRSRATAIIFSHFQVERVECKGKQGLAYISISSDGSLTAGVLDKKIRHIDQKWDLRRGKSGWTVTPPGEIIYLPRTAAVRIFAQQLARLADTTDAKIADSTSSEESQLASLLSGLLNN